MWGALTDVDGHDHVAWLATVDGRPAGIARFVRVAPCTADIAFEVADEHQGLGPRHGPPRHGHHGRGRHADPSAAGVRAGHEPASQHLLSRIGLTLQPSDGILEGESLFHLIDRPRVDRPAVLRLAFAARSREAR